MTSGRVIGRLLEIERELEELQPAYADASSRFASLDREVKRRTSEVFLDETGTQRERDAKAHVRVALTVAFSRLADAEEELMRLRALVHVLEQRATIGMSILKRIAAEVPEWTPTA